MDAVTESTMAINSTFNSILNEIQLSRLNFTINLTPFAAHITLKKSAQVDKLGNPLSPSPPILFLLQQSSRDLLVARDEIKELVLTLKACEEKCVNLKNINSSLLKKIEVLDKNDAITQEKNDDMSRKLDERNKDVKKLDTFNNNLRIQVKKT